MTKRLAIIAIIALLFTGAAYVAYKRWWPLESSARDAILSRMPASASTVVLADFAELRSSPFAEQLYAWAPPPQQFDSDYAKFLRETGFDYERDLDRIALAVTKSQQNSSLLAIADGRFDRKKLNLYASQYGTHEKVSGHEVFTIPVRPVPSDSNRPASAPSGQKSSVVNPPAASPHKISFAFLTNNRIALTTDSNPASLFTPPATGADAKDWHERFNRLAGSPIFAIIRQDASPGAAINARAPGGLQSPQLASLLDQLSWITIAGRPEGNVLRLAAEGECPSDPCSHQLSDMLNGILLLAQAGLNGPDVRRQLAPEAREAYLELLKSMDVSRIDRGETKSVRLVLEVTPKFLAAARSAPAPVPQK